MVLPSKGKASRRQSWAVSWGRTDLCSPNHLPGGFAVTERALRELTVILGSLPLSDVSLTLNRTFVSLERSWGEKPRLLGVTTGLQFPERTWLGR